MTHVTRDDFGRIVLWLDDCACEDCQLRETEGPRDDKGELRYTQPPSLTPDGSPAYHPVYGFRMTSGCTGCGGTGRSSQEGSHAFEENVLHTRLTLKQRFVMERRLGFVDERKYSQREIAAAMGISQQAVAKHETAAKDRLEATVRKGLYRGGCSSTSSPEGKSRAGEEKGHVSHRRVSSPSVYHSPPQRTSASTSWDIYFAGSRDAHSNQKGGSAAGRSRSFGKPKSRTAPPTFVHTGEDGVVTRLFVPGERWRAYKARD